LLLLMIHDASNLDKFNTSAIFIHNYFDCDCTYRSSQAKRPAVYGAAVRCSRISFPAFVVVCHTLVVAHLVHSLCASLEQNIPSDVWSPFGYKDCGFL
jgi:hypothetical protein